LTTPIRSASICWSARAVKRLATHRIRSNQREFRLGMKSIISGTLTTWLMGASVGVMS